MSPEVVTSILALFGGLAALITARISAANSATKEELEDLRRRVDKLNEELQTERDSNDKLRAQINAAEDSVVAAAAEKTELKIQIETMKCEIASRDRQIKQQDATIKKQEARIKELETRVSEMEALMRGGKCS